MTTTIITKRSWAQTLGTGGKFVILGLAAFLTLGPVVWTFVTALSPTDSVTQEVTVGFGAFADVFTKIPLWLYAWNSALVVMLVAAGQMLSAAMAGYVFAKFEFRSKKLLFALILATMMVPLQVTIVPVFMLVRGMGLADTLLALIVPALPTAFGTFLMRQYFMGIPTELGEAAQLDGAGAVAHVLRRVPAAGDAGPRDRRHPRLQLSLERVLPTADHDHQRSELHVAARSRDTAGEPRHRQHLDGARRSDPVHDPRPPGVLLRAEAAARGTHGGRRQVIDTRTTVERRLLR